MLPLTTETQKKVALLQSLIAENHGEVLPLEVEQLSNASHAKMMALFNEQREAEYMEFLDGCRTFQQEIESETALGNFTFHEVEENEAELVRLKRWYRKILKRDFFHSEHAVISQRMLDECELSLRDFTHLVYQAEGRTEGELM